MTSKTSITQTTTETAKPQVTKVILPSPRDLRDQAVKSMIDAIPGSWER